MESAVKKLFHHRSRRSTGGAVTSGTTSPNTGEEADSTSSKSPEPSRTSSSSKLSIHKKWSSWGGSKRVPTATGVDAEDWAALYAIPSASAPMEPSAPPCSEGEEQQQSPAKSPASYYPSIHDRLIQNSPVVPEERKVRDLITSKVARMALNDDCYTSLAGLPLVSTLAI